MSGDHQKPRQCFEKARIGSSLCHHQKGRNTWTFCGSVRRLDLVIINKSWLRQLLLWQTYEFAFQHDQSSMSLLVILLLWLWT